MPLATYAHFADRDPLTRVVLERMLAGVSTRRYARTREPVGEEVDGASAVDVEVGGVATFVERTARTLAELMSAAASTTSAWR